MMTSHLLHVATGFAESDPNFIGYVLLQYRQVLQLNSAALAARLECGDEGLRRLVLCQVPLPGAGYDEDLARIAAYAGCAPERLAEILRQAP